ncbi:collagen-flanked surface repeat-containing protein, partial [Streptococcus criceti]
MGAKHRKQKYLIQKKEYFSIRKFKFGAASALIGISLFTSGAVMAEEQAQLPANTSATEQVQANAPDSSTTTVELPDQSATTTTPSSQTQAENSVPTNGEEVVTSAADTTTSSAADSKSQEKADSQGVNQAETPQVETAKTVAQDKDNTYIFYKVRYFEQNPDGTKTLVTQTPAKSVVVPTNEADIKMVIESANLRLPSLYGYTLSDWGQSTQGVVASELKKTKYIDFYVKRIDNSAVATATNGESSVQIQDTQDVTEQLGGNAQSSLNITASRNYQVINEASNIRPIVITVTKSGKEAEVSQDANDDKKAQVTFTYTKEGLAGEQAGLPAGLTFNAETGKIEGTVLQSGQYSITARAQVGKDAPATTTFDLDVNALPKSDQAVFAGHAISSIAVNGGSQATATNFSYSAIVNGQTIMGQGLPEGLSYDKTTGKITGQVTQPGTYTILSQASVAATNLDGSYANTGAVTYVTESHLYVAKAVTQGQAVPRVTLTATAATNPTIAPVQPTNVQTGESVFRAIMNPETVDGVDGAMKLGDFSEANHEYDTAIGYHAKTNTGVPANNGGAVAIGVHTTANGENAIAIGNGSTSSDNSAIALGGKSSGVGAINISYQGSANGSSAVNVGYYAKTNGEYGTAIGGQAKSTGILATAIGGNSSANDYRSTAIGAQSGADGYNTTAIGSGSKAIATNATAIGTGGSATYDNSATIGSDSKTDAAATRETQATVNGITYSGFAGSSDAIEEGSQVSVGSKDHERQIKNVAAGAVSEESTDAINGSQLYLFEKNSHWTVTTGTAGTGTQTQVHDTDVAPDNQDVHSGDKVTFRAGNYLNIEQNGDVITYSVNTQKPKLEVVSDGKGGYTIKYTDAFGQYSEAPFTVATIKGEKGDKGEDGKNGKDGKSAMATVETKADGTKVITTGYDQDGDGTISNNERTSATVKDGATGATGADGKDGKSASATVTDNNDGTKTITITNADGSTTTATVKDGKDGKSASATVTDNNDGTKTITITNADG